MIISSSVLAIFVNYREIFQYSKPTAARDRIKAIFIPICVENCDWSVKLGPKRFEQWNFSCKGLKYILKRIVDRVNSEKCYKNPWCQVYNKMNQDCPYRS